ncbi:MAG: carbohydrate ABC transporter permease [Defluviitaleaceae bacterium]|nr:carbohydrate ABC transporter permease [Defluviitaleaceae bacterium]
MVDKMKSTLAHPRVARLKQINYRNLFVYAILILISYQFIYPLLRMVSMSLMTEDDIINPVVNWIPQSLSFSNFRTALRVMQPMTTYFNSLWFSGIQALGSTLVAAMAGFALARYDFPLKKFWFFMIIVAFIIPLPVMMVPRTMMVINLQDYLQDALARDQFRLLGTVWPQFLLAFGGQGVFSTILILIFYNFTRMIPPALDEAAAIDGASSMKIFYHIILKLSVSTLLVIFLLSFVWNWNETHITNQFLRPGSLSIELVTSRLQAFEGMFDEFAGMSGGIATPEGETGSEMERINEAFRMSGTLISILPLFVLYLLVQKHFIKGIENTGLTGI